MTTQETLPSRRRGRFVGSVVRNDRICTDHFKLVIRVAGFLPSRPGQFVQIDCGSEQRAAEITEYRVHEWTPGTPLTVSDPDSAAALAYLRRPFSLAGRRDVEGTNTELDVIYRSVGKATRFMQHLGEGAAISLLGPLGNGFTVPDALRGGVALLVGGGVGIPPMFYLAEVLHQQGIRAVGFVGAQRKDLVPVTISPCNPAPSPTGEPVLNALEFANYGYPTVIATDDGSWGLQGFVTQAVRKFLQTTKQQALVFCCGPTPMMRATAKLCAEFSVPCQVSMEQPMACGMGTCQSCVVRWSPGGTGEWVYRLTCTDGPVFDARDIHW